MWHFRPGCGEKKIFLKRGSSDYIDGSSINQEIKKFGFAREVDIVPDFPIYKLLITVVILFFDNKLNYK